MTRKEAIMATATFLHQVYSYNASHGAGDIVSMANIMAAEADGDIDTLNKYLCEVEDFIHKLKVGLTSTD